MLIFLLKELISLNNLWRDDPIFTYIVSWLEQILSLFAIVYVCSFSLSLRPYDPLFTWLTIKSCMITTYHLLHENFNLEKALKKFGLICFDFHGPLMGLWNSWIVTTTLSPFLICDPKLCKMETLRVIVGI